MQVPDEDARLEILKVVTARMRLGTPSSTPQPQDSDVLTSATESKDGGSGADVAPSGFDYRAIARATPGYVGADIVALAKEAAVCAVNRAFGQLFTAESLAGPETASAPGDGLVIPAADMWQCSTDALRSTAPLTPEQMVGLCVSFDDFMAALPKVQPAATREGFATIPNVTWADVGALAQVRGDLEMAIVQV